MGDNATLGDRVKGYESVQRTILPRRTYTLMRLDGRAFHTYLRGFDKHTQETVQAVATRSW